MKKQLRERLAELEVRLHRIEDHLDQPPDQDREDNAIESEMDQVLEGLEHAGNAEIQAIYAALAPVKGSIYGVWPRCGDDISEERLDVLPHTPFARGRAEELAHRYLEADVESL